MTTYSIVISGVTGTYDITPKTRAARLERSLGESSATLDLDCHDLTDNHCMDSIVLTVDGVVRFAGTVKSQTDKKDGTLKVSELQCVDNTDKLQRRIVAQVYEGKTAKQMIEGMIATYASWVSTAAVQDIGGAVESVVFNYDTVSTAIQKVADLVGAYWYLDANDGLHFFQDFDTDTTVVYDATSNILRDSFDLQTSAMDLVNRVWVIGAKTSSQTFIEQSWTGDGQNAIFSTAYEQNYPEVYEAGEKKTIETEKGSESDKDYTYNKKDKVLKRTAGNLPSGVQLRFKYRPTVQVIDYFEDPGSIAVYGLYEKAIRDKKLTTREAARKRGRAELKKYKTFQRLPAWSSRTWKANVGDLVMVNVPSFEFAAKCRIERISVSFTPRDIVATFDGVEVLV